MSKQLLFSVVLATGIVASGIWIADQSMKSNSATDDAAMHESKPVGISEAHAPRSIVSQPVDDATGSIATNPSSASPSRISKCIIDGKITYSDSGCPDRAKHQPIALHDSGGIVSPPKESLADLTAKRKAAERAYALQAQAQVAATGRSGNTECEELDKRVADLDSMARQPHSGVMADWIKNERKAVRDRQFAMHC
jgi:hypothetical protein